MGAGILGLLTARACARAGMTVAVYDAAAPGQASWAAGGILWPLGPWHYADSVYANCQAGSLLYPDLCADLYSSTGIDPEFWRCGLLLLDAAEPDAVSGWLARHAEPCEPVDATTLRRRHPRLRTGPGPHFWFSEVAQLRPPRLLAAVRADLHAHAVRLHERTAVTRLNRDAQVVYLNLHDGTQQQCARAVIAAGAWSAALLPETHAAQQSLRPVRGQMLCYRARPGLLDCIVLQGQRYLIPRRDGRILVGSTTEDAGFDATPTVQALAALKAFAEQLLPELAGVAVERHWAGLRPGSPEDLPWVEAIAGMRGIFLASGHYRYGITQAPASALEVVRLLQASA